MQLLQQDVVNLDCLIAQDLALLGFYRVYHAIHSISNYNDSVFLPIKRVKKMFS